MLNSLAKVLGLIVGLALSGVVHAVGMGGIDVTTALGEPLQAEIALVAVSKADKSDMSARLATPDAFKAAGLDYPGALPKLKFQVETRGNGEPYLKVTTAQPVNEPFVSLLVELTWPSGKLLREYTFLLDPPGFRPEPPAEVEVQPLEPSVAGRDEPRAAEPVASAGKEEPMTLRASAPVDEKTAAGEAAATKKFLVKGNVASGTITVKSGDTLSKIASEVKSSDVSLERMLVAMYRANEEAFDGSNMNRLKTGKILRLPEDGALSQVEQEDAVKEIHAQSADWHAYRMKLAAASGSSAEQAPRQEASGKISAMVADKAPVAQESAKEVVRLSKGEAPGDKAATAGNAKALQDKLHAMEEEAAARNKALKESNERIALLEKNIKDMQRLIELKGQAIAPVKQEPVKPEVAKPEVKPEPAKVETKPALPPAASAEKTVKKPKPVAAPKVETPPQSLLDEILGEPLYLAGIAAVLLGLGGAGFMLARRRKVIVSVEDASSTGAHIAAPIAPSPDTGDFTHTVTAAPISTIEPDDVDPISEADLFLNFGRDAQAEEILKDALNKTPGNQQIRLKLLSIYANRKDVSTFTRVAHEVRESGDLTAWAQAAEMGRKLEPGNPMYGSADSAQAIAQDMSGESKDEQTVAGLDFDLGFDEPAAAGADSTSTIELDVPLEASSSSGLDFDLGLGAPEEAAPAVADNESTLTVSSAQADTTSVLDFDLGFDLPTEAEAATPVAAEAESDALLAPEAGAHEEINAQEEIQVAQESPLDFDITAAHPGLSTQQPEQAEEPMPSVDDLVFDVTALHLSPAAMMEEMSAAEEQEKSAESTAFTLDFPITEEAPAEDMAETASAKVAGAIDLSEINLNLDAPAHAPAEEVRDAHWQDVATKLDLARAYQEMGDASGACEILEEVLNEGDAQQRAAAEVMMQQLSA